MRKVRFLLIPTIGAQIEHDAALGGDANYNWIKRAIDRFFDEPFEHVTVLYEGRRRDMFVGETSAVNGRHIRNVRATEIYRNNWLTRHPRADPESLPAISGPVVLFPDFLVWK